MFSTLSFHVHDVVVAVSWFVCSQIYQLNKFLFCLLIYSLENFKLFFYVLASCRLKFSSFNKIFGAVFIQMQNDALNKIFKIQ